MGLVWPVLFWVSAGCILYHLAGYPLILFLLARILKKPVRRAEFLPFISVIIPAFNEGGVIREKIRSVLNSRYPAACLEIIVPEDGSTDDTAEQVQSLGDPRIFLDHSPTRGGKMAAINRAVRRARGEFLVFTDANAVLKPETLQNLMSNFADPQVGCVSGSKRMSGANEVDSNENIYWRYESWIKHNESLLGSCPAAVGELMAVRRSVFNLPASKIINDDFQIALNTVEQGYRAIYDSTAVTFEKSSNSIRDEYGRKTRIAAGRWQVFLQVSKLAFRSPAFVFSFFSHKLLRLLVFPLMILVLIGNLGALLSGLSGQTTGLPVLLALKLPWGGITLAGQLLFYILAGVGALLDQKGHRVKPLFFLWYFLSAQMASINGLSRFVSGSQSVIWRKVSR